MEWMGFVARISKLRNEYRMLVKYFTGKDTDVVEKITFK
jgi:hypothetical protein